MDRTEKVFDFANAVLATQMTVLLGLVDAKIVDPKRMRDFLQSVLDAMKPQDRHDAYGACLYHVVSALESQALPKPKPIELN